MINDDKDLPKEGEKQSLEEVSTTSGVLDTNSNILKEEREEIIEDRTEHSEPTQQPEPLVEAVEQKVDVQDHLEASSVSPTGVNEHIIDPVKAKDDATEPSESKDSVGNGSTKVLAESTEEKDSGSNLGDGPSVVESASPGSAEAQEKSMASKAADASTESSSVNTPGIDLKELERELDSEIFDANNPKSRSRAGGGSQQEFPAIADFSDPLLDETVVEAVKSIGWDNPTEIQKKSLPYTLRGKDLAGFAQTGTGKTGVFLITLANNWQKKREERKIEPKKPFALILTPTRELAIQIEQDSAKLFESLGISTLALYGGADWEKQQKALENSVNVVVATPGRLKDFLKKKIISFDNIEVFICDEVDRMFDMGFLEDVEHTVNALPEKSQRLIFSATTNDNVCELAFEYLDHPQYVYADMENITPDAIHQELVLCETPQKLLILLGLFREHAPQRSIIFCNTKLTAAWLHYKLVNNGIESDIITGDLPQNQRIRLIQRIKGGEIKVLIATDVASRGLHISGLTHVYNFDLPDEAANYVHRIGRTARAGAEGAAYSLVCDEYGENLNDIRAIIGESGPKVGWFNEDYLSIEDKAGNPFEDNFGKGFPEVERERPRTNRWGRDRNEREGSSDRPNRSFDRSRDGRAQQQNIGDENRITHKTMRNQKRRIQTGALSSDSRQDFRKPQSAVSQSKSVSFFGLLKKLFYTLFPFLGKKETVKSTASRDSGDNRNKRDNRGGRQQRPPYRGNGRNNHNHRSHSGSNHRQRNGGGDYKPRDPNSSNNRPENGNTRGDAQQRPGRGYKPKSDQNGNRSGNRNNYRGGNRNRTPDGRSGRGVNNSSGGGYSNNHRRGGRDKD